jgi:hypothetical protein
MNLCKIALLIVLFTVAQSQAPDQFSWDSVNGTSYIPEVHNQNFPSPCNSGWAFSAVDVFNSRMKIKRKSASPDL